MMNILICDDVKKDADKLTRLLNDLNIKPVVFDNGQDVLKYVHTGAAVDGCFLDIVMPEMSGVALAEKLRSDGFKGEIIFLSTSNDYAHQSYKVKAFSYLLKPPTPESVRNILNELEYARRNTDMAGIIINVSGIARFILFRDISHIEVINHCVYFRMIGSEEIGVYTTFSEVASQLLKDRRFVQCHRSYIVNMNDVVAATEREFTLQNLTKIPISRNYPFVKQKYMQWMFGGDTK